MQITYKIIGWSLGALLLLFSLISLQQGLWPFLLLITSAVLVIPFFEQYRKKIKLAAYPALFIGSVMGFIGINGIKFDELEKASDKIDGATAQKNIKPEKELEPLEILNGFSGVTEVKELSACEFLPPTDKKICAPEAAGKDLQVFYLASTAWSEKGYTADAAIFSKDFLKKAYALCPACYVNIRIRISVPTADKYGNEGETTAFFLNYSVDEVAQINWDNSLFVNVLNIAEPEAYGPGIRSAKAYCLDEARGSTARIFCNKLFGATGI